MSESDLALVPCNCGSSRVSLIEDYSPEHGWFTFVKCDDCAREVNHGQSASASLDVAREDAVNAWNAAEFDK